MRGPMGPRIGGCRAGEERRRSSNETQAVHQPSITQPAHARNASKGTMCGSAAGIEAGWWRAMSAAVARGHSVR
jgi:hypothetical protein